MVDGVVMVVDNYAKRLLKYADVVVFVPEVFGKKYDDSTFPYKVVRCKSLKVPFSDYSLPMPKITYKFKSEIKKYKLDLIHIHSPFTIGKYGMEYAKKHNIPLIATMHSQFKRDFKRYFKIEQITKPLLREVIKVFDAADECWAVNAEVGRIFHEEYGYKTIPYVMRNATELKPVENINKSNHEINKKYNLHSNETVFLFVGRINRLKNILFIIDSLKVVKMRKFKFKMLFVGVGQDEELLKEAIYENGLENEIILCGKIMDRDLLSRIYARADLFLFPSLYDSSSIVQIEAASQKTPTVFIEGSATSATVTNNVNGLTSKNDIYDYADVIIKVMKDNKMYNKISENAFNDLYVHWDDAIKEVYNRYLFIIENKKRK
jgi:glycosyltransferase involved in cell wall biosynthesis